MAEVFKLKKPRKIAVDKGIRTIVKDIQEELNTNGCDSMVVIMAKKAELYMLSSGKSAIHRAGLCEYAKTTLINSLERI